MSDSIKVGDMVETCVYVCHQRIPMDRGRVISINGGVAEVDVMSHHGGAPWVKLESVCTLMKVTP